MTQEQEHQDLVETLKKHPKLFSRVRDLLRVVENNEGDIKKASDAEMRVIEEVRQIGLEALQSWATSRAGKASEEVKQREGVRSAGKKNSAGTARSGLLK